MENNYSDLLKNCPFCGKKANVVFAGLRQSGYWKGRIVAQCTNCGAEAGRTAYRGDPIMGDLLKTYAGQNAVEAWNRRRTNRVESVDFESRIQGGT